MKARQMTTMTSGHSIKRSIANLLKHPVGQNQNSGFCICPSCGHFVFDTTLTGNCPHCRCHFCPSCAAAKRSH